MEIDALVIWPFGYQSRARIDGFVGALARFELRYRKLAVPTLKGKPILHRHQ
jgi:hypothetical protein